MCCSYEPDSLSYCSVYLTRGGTQTFTGPEKNKHRDRNVTEWIWVKTYLLESHSFAVVKAVQQNGHMTHREM